MCEEYNSKHYHQPSDEFQADWDFTALQQAAEYGFLLGQDVANQANLVGLAAGGPVPPVGVLTILAGYGRTATERP